MPSLILSHLLLIWLTLVPLICKRTCLKGQCQDATLIGENGPSANTLIGPGYRVDVNECEDPSYCRNGRCVNTPGSFRCICEHPLTFSAALKQCVYDDRTAAHKDMCFQEVDEDLVCSMPRSELTVTYSECCCHYGRGWGSECQTCPNRHSVLFNRLCEMHLETESEGDSSEEDSAECSCANGRCVLSYLGTMCECNTGFVLDHSRTRCTDIDECAGRGTRSSPCKNARCINTHGSFRCHCKRGFVARQPNVCIRARALQLRSPHTFSHVHA